MRRRGHELHKLGSLGWLRASVLGANDGIVSTSSLILGVAAAHASHANILLTGVAGLVAGAMSMATGEYVSVHSQADTEAAALAQEGIWAVVTGEDARKLSDPFLIALKAPIEQWSLAVERVRYVGEPVALVVADTRYLAEDAAELLSIDYEILEAVVDPQAARSASAPLLHAQAKSNEISARKFSYGDSKSAFERADARVALTCEYPRNSFTPMECYVVVAEHRPADDSYDVLANFQGPFSTHPVMARALRVAGPKLRLRIPPDSGGSFGIKLSVFPYIVLAAIAARITGRPVTGSRPST